MSDPCLFLCRRPARQGHCPRRALFPSRRGTLDQGRPRRGQWQGDPHAGLQRHEPSDEVKVDGNPLAARRGHARLALPQAAGLVVTEKDPEGRPTIFSTLEQQGLPRVVSVGRLDINTEGLLLLTNDGGLKRVLELPATGWLRRYRVRAFGTHQPAAARRAQGRARGRWRQIRADRSHARARAGQQCLARPGTARGQEPRGQERAGGARPQGQPADPRQLRAVPAERSADRRGRGGQGARAARAARQAPGRRSRRRFRQRPARAGRASNSPAPRPIPPFAPPRRARRSRRQRRRTERLPLHRSHRQAAAATVPASRTARRARTRPGGRASRSRPASSAQRGEETRRCRPAVQRKCSQPRRHRQTRVRGQALRQEAAARSPKPEWRSSAVQEELGQAQGGFR